MAEMSLKDLSGALGQMAKNSPKIQSDVELIRIAICGKGGILEAMTKMENFVEDLQKNKTLSNLTGGGGKGEKEKNQKKLLKSTDAIASTLGKILDNVKKMDKGGGTRGLSGANFKREKQETGKKFGKLDGISKALDIVDKLKSLSFKDLLFAKMKIKHVFKVMSRSLNIFRMFKNNKEANNTISFMDAAIPITKKLTKIGMMSKFAIKGAETIESIFAGNKKRGGILKTFRKIHRHKKEIKTAKKDSKSILLAVGLLFLTSMLMVGVAALGPGVMLGTLMTSGIIILLLGTFKLMAGSSKAIQQGSLAFLKLNIGLFLFSLGFGILRKAVEGIGFKEAFIMALCVVGTVALLVGMFILLDFVLPLIAGGVLAFIQMSVGLLAFSLGFSILRQATKNMDLEDVGVMSLSIIGIGLSVAGIGLLSVPIVVGSLSLLVIGAALGILYLSLKAWRGFDAKKPIENVKIGIAGIKEALGMNDDKESGSSALSSIGDSVMGMITAFFQFGKVFFQMGAILIASIVLGILTLTLRFWDNYDPTKAIKNIKTGIAGMKEALGIDEREGESAGGQLAGIGHDILGMITAFLQFGKVFFQMGAILIATVTLAIVRLTLYFWDNYDPSKAIGNIDLAITGLKSSLGIEDREDEGIIGQVGGLFSDVLSLGSAFLQMGKVFFQMGAILLATVVMAIVKNCLEVWDNYNPTKAIGNIDLAITGLKSILGMKDTEDEGFLSQIGDAVSDMFALGTSLIEMGKVFVQMGTLLIATAILAYIKDTLTKWDNYNPSKALKNIKSTITGLEEILGMDQPEPEPEPKEEEGGFWSGVGDFFSGVADTVGDVVGAVGDCISGIAGTASAIASFGPKFTELSQMLTATGTMLGILQALKPWDNFNPTKPLSNIKSTLSGVKALLSSDDTQLDPDEAEDFADAAFDIMKGMNYIRFAVMGAKKTSKSLNRLHRAFNRWGTRTYKHAIMMAKSINVIRWAFDKVDEDSLEDKSQTLMDLFEVLHDNEIQRNLSSVPISRSVRAINALDMEKANMMMSLFKTIGLIKEEKPFELFDNAVDRFVEGCNTIVESMSNIINPEANEKHNIFGFGDDKKKQQTEEVSGGVSITNTQQLAEAIARALKNLNVRINPNMIDVNLVAETGSGKTVKLTLRD